MMSACPSGRDQRQSGLTAHEMPALGFFLLCFGGVLVPGGNFRRILVELRKAEKWGMEENRR